VRRGASHVSKPERLGLSILTVGGALGLVVGGGPAGLALAAVCLVAGFVLFVASKARGTGPRPTAAQKPQPAHQKAQVLFLVKEVHARPQRGGKFQEIRDSNEPDWEFEVFLHCWLLNETDLTLQIVEGPQLTLRTSDGSTRLGERIGADLEHWRLGKLVKDEWDPEIVRAVQAPVSELNTADPLACGVPREGWLHFRIRNLSPSEFKTGEMELSIKDSLSCTHVGAVSGPRHLPGRIWPFVAHSVSVARNEAAASPRAERR
jgi:hypothetical protein